MGLIQRRGVNQAKVDDSRSNINDVVAFARFGASGSDEPVDAETDQTPERKSEIMLTISAPKNADRNPST